MYRGATIGILLLLSVSCVPAQAADDALLKRGIDKLFEVGWDTAVKSREEADQVAAKIDELFPGDSRGSYAYVLVLAKQRRYPEAAQRMQQVVEFRPDDAAAWQMKIRLAMLTKEYSAALADIDRLSRLLPATLAGDADTEAGHRQTARFLGRMIGYLEGPTEDGATEALLTATKDNVLARLGEHRLPAFEEGRRRVREIYSSLVIEKEETEVSEKAAAEEEQRKFLQDLETERKEIDPTKAALQDESDKIRSEAQAEIEEITQEERPLVEQLARLESQAILIRRERAVVFDNVSRLNLALNRERDPIIRGQLVLELDRVRRFGNRYDSELLLLERRAAAINAQRFALRRRLQQTQAGVASRLNEIGEELEGLEKKEKRLTVQEKKETRAPTGRTRIVRLLETEMAAFGTYDEFPLELEKQRVLDWFASPTP